MPERLDALHEAARATAARLLDGEVVRATINEADPHVRTVGAPTASMRWGGSR
jgi:hypothetical protein